MRLNGTCGPVSLVTVIGDCLARQYVPTRQSVDVLGGRRYRRIPVSTPKLDAFLAQAHETPFLVVDLDVVAERYRRLDEALAGVRIFYAVKANPAAPVLRTLVALGSAFDVASPAEIDACLDAGAMPQDLSFGNTIKKARDVSAAHRLDINRYTVDASEELQKVLTHAPGADVCVRLFHDGAEADWPLSRKFGCDHHDALQLMTTAAEAGHRTGVSFHVGSQQRSPQAWDDALAAVNRLMRDARPRGVTLDFLNLGGGFPSHYVDDVAPVEAYGAAITQALRQLDEPVPELMVEPGRYLVGDAGVLRTEVVLVSRRSIDERRWVYLDCGRFSGLAETMDEAIRYRLRTPYGDEPAGPVVLAGPTCDSADVLYDKASYLLPLALRDGDLVDVLSAGAYTTAYAAPGFNGLPAPAEHYI
jgi:ornithine decarboxylase